MKAANRVAMKSYFGQNNVKLNRARMIVRWFGEIPYGPTWETLIGKPKYRPHGCLIDAFEIPCTIELREEIAFAAAQALREAFPQYTSSRKNWHSKIWTDSDIDRILAIVLNSVHIVLQRESPYASDCRTPIAVPLERQANGFRGWRPFRWRSPVSQLPGIYLIAHFPLEGESKIEADPSDIHVIYIGMAEGQGTGDRLQQFEDTALGRTGHSAGWSFRTLFVPQFYENNLSDLKNFTNIYCSWCDVVDARPRDIEAKLIADFVELRGQRPLLNLRG